MTPTFTPAFFIPIWFNIILFLSGITLVLATLYFLVKPIFQWFVHIPLFAYGLHFSTFYGVILFSQLSCHALNNEIMTLWSAILRFHGIATAGMMLYILYLTFGDCRKNE